MTKRTKILLFAVLCLGLVGTFTYRQIQSANAASQIHYRTEIAATGDVTDAVEASGVGPAADHGGCEIPCWRTHDQACRGCGIACQAGDAESPELIRQTRFQPTTRRRLT